MGIPEPIILRSFAGGELSPSLGARADVGKYGIGLRTCRNWMVHRHGGLSNRSGTVYVGTAKTNSANARLIPYVATVPGESVLIEMGSGYLRFWYQGAQVALDVTSITAWNGATTYIEGDLVKVGSTIYYCKLEHTNQSPPNTTYWHVQTGDILEVPTPFTEVHDTKWVQSGQVITFTHQDEVPHDLFFEDLTTWRMIAVETEPQLGVPQTLVLSAGGGNRKFGYRVTAAHPLTYEESEPSTQVISLTAADPTTAAPHTLSWAALSVDGTACPEYYVYCDPFGNGTYGYIGTATGATTFNNPGLIPDFSQTPPLARDLFEGGTKYPGVCAYQGQRRWFANFPGGGDTICGSRVGFPNNFGISSPLQDDDAITARIAGNNQHAVQWLLELKDLIAMTDGGEWRMVGRGGDVITPNTIGFDQETYVGVDTTVTPCVIGNNVIYIQGRGSIVRDLRFDQGVEGLAGRDLTLFANHLFDGYTIDALAYQQTPDSIVWLVRSDGTLLGLTYLHEQDIWAWHRHDTDGGLFEDVCVVPEPGEDATYVFVRRTLGANVVRYIEKLHPRTVLDAETEGVFLDSALTYSGAATSSVSGLDHLSAKTVGICGDGVYLGTAVVSSGAVTLPSAASYIVIGLPIEADAETLDLDVSGSQIRTAKKRVQSVTLLLDNSSRAFQAGPDSTRLRRYAPPSHQSATKQFNGQAELPVTALHDLPGRVFIRHDRPLPMTILGIVPHVDVGS